MPALFQGSCSACGTVTDRTVGSCEAVLVEGSAVGPNVHPEMPNVVVLAHPRQLEILQELGLSGQAAHWAGRLIEIENVICRSCGRMFEMRRLSAGLPALGLWGAGGAVACVVAFSVGTGFLVGGEWQGFVVGGCLLVVLLASLDRGLKTLIRSRHKERAAQVDTPSECPDCGHAFFDSLERLRLEPTQSALVAKCPTCGVRAMTHRIVGSI